MRWPCDYMTQDDLRLITWRPVHIEPELPDPRRADPLWLNR